MTNVLVLLVCGSIVGSYALIVRRSARISRFARRVSLCTALGFGVLATLFVSGYAFEDLPLTTAIVMTAAWVVPMVGVGLWAWFSPRTAEPAIWTALATLLGLAVWWAVAPEFWGAVMDEQGPIVAIASLAVGVVLATWGYHRPLRGGLALMVVALVPVIGVLLTAEFNALAGATSSVAAVSPFLTCGLLYLISTRLLHEPAPSRAPSGPALPSHP